MSLTQALATAVSGLRVSQAGLSIVAGNVANAGTPGYVRKTVSQVMLAPGGNATGVRMTGVQRQLDEYVQRQLRGESAGAGYADIRAQFYQRLQQLYGQPGSSTSISGVFNSFTSALQSLSSSPDDFSSRNAVLSTAQALTQQLNDMSSAIQTMRLDAENGIDNAVFEANAAMSQIASINAKLGTGSGDLAQASLEDERDAAIDRLSHLIDITVRRGDHNQVQVFSGSGVQLVGVQASQFRFSPAGTITALSLWDKDPTKSLVGELSLITPSGAVTDMLRTGGIRSGQIEAYLQLRDHDLVEAQNQLDTLAAALSQSLSDRTIAGSAVTAGLQNGFTIDVGSLLAGNAVTVKYTDSVTNTQRTLNLVRMDDASMLPLPTGTGTTKTIGIDFSLGMADVVAQINDALANTGMTASNAGTVVQLLDDGINDTATINSVSARVTANSFTSGSAELPFFLDNGFAYTDLYSPSGRQSFGLAGRISVNAALLADPSKLVMYGSNVEAGDTTRPEFLYQKIVSGTQAFASNSGIGLESAPYTGTLGEFLGQVLSKQGAAASNADTLQQGQQMVLSALQQRYSDGASVNIDQEMTMLLTLQNAYAANARVMATVKEMFELLLAM
jgi:flagellar hook-associated protein 1 FlgK